MRRFLPAVCLTLLCLFAPPAAADGLVLGPPVPGRAVRAFDQVGPYAAGHRGVDLAATPGSPVVAAALGTVHFAGSVAGTQVVSIDHGNGWRTTYQPVRAAVSVGQRVTAGQRIGTLLAGHCVPAACLHWGLTDGTAYADPMAYRSTPVVRLVPAGTLPSPPPALAAASAGGMEGLPVDGRRTSGFGLRRHPITGVVKLHDGTDLAAPCGTPIRAPAAGTVTRAYYNGAYGWRIFLDHGGGLVTAYNHLPGLEVRIGQSVAAGERIAAVGSTGLSTGCHLHWMAWRGGELIDPLTLAP